jgi:phytoene dehydrogenase-like protein
MQTLTDKLAENLGGEIRTQTEVLECKTENGKWKIKAG